MSGPLPTHPDTERIGTGRLAAAAALRRLVHTLVDHEASDATLEELAAVAGDLAARLGAGAPRLRPDDAFSRWQHVHPDGEPLYCSVDCLVSGPANPLSAGGAARRDGDEAVLEVTLAAGFEGLSGRAHGGIIASLFDEVMGFSLYMHGVAAYTAWLRVDYRSAVPVGMPVELRARVVRREGRKCWIEGELTSAEGPGPTAEALFVVPRGHE
jgi:acyl-coenzyme A thioesterase PaaI-like protein